MSNIFTGAKFNSFAEFDDAFEEWKVTKHHPFRVASSETLRMPDGTTNDLFRYRYIVYHCTHYGAPRMRGVGKRPNQNYLPCGCRAMLRLNFSWAENALRITTLNDLHTGHEVNEESYSRFSSKIRRPSPATVGSSVDGDRGSAPSANSSPVSTPSPRMVTPRRPTPKMAQHSPFANTYLAVNTPKPKNQHHLPSAVSTTTSSSILTNSIKHEIKENVARGAVSATPATMFPPPPAMAAAAMLGALSPSAFNLGQILAAVQLQQQLQQQQQQRCKPQTEPLDLSGKERGDDSRSDDQKLDLIHPVLQGLNEHLLSCYGQDFDNKLNQMRLLIKQWQTPCSQTNAATGHSAKDIWC